MLKVGAKAPAFRLESDEGKEIALKDFAGQRVQFDKLNVAIFGMSADPVKALAGFKEKHKLNFPLLSDPTHKTIQKFGVWQKKQFMGRTFMGIVRSSFVIGKTGKIEELWPLVRAKGHASEVLRVISKS